ncbi:molybdopterin-synthase adenylyltransferase MoeB [Nitrosomonas sp. Nm166]|uniref:HesA/MoeB/ThiF family protein n=1 Tax=Nitrosomonas sp. Nm166 TaxID=1881054 RepID=UPI0008E93988|nr:molybdopterin-synthase adenylyltransferase MoeB [Nitrosomonas sp. Nm166]SFE36880.1 Molybdopterin or thiamine biosynthesis adenylyltransferase [Nitrosomonas sp. Nm166]
MNDNQLLRYSRHILLSQIDIEGQEKLNQSSVLIVGAGGLGSPVAMYLAASGVGNLIICDGDQVDLTNLQRQIIHNSDSIGQAKVLSAKQSLVKINPEVNVIAIQEHVDAIKLRQLAAEVDAVVDASDNFSTRYHVNYACVLHKKPLISGAAVRFDGQVSVFDLRYSNSPCYHCLYPADGRHEDMPCAVMGVFSPLVGIIGCMQAAETLKILLNIGESLNGRLLLLEGLTMNWRSIKLHKDPACPVCYTTIPTPTYAVAISR